MPSAAELRNELKELRKSHPDYAPVSKMHKADVASLLQKLKVHTEETPASGQMKDASKKVKPASVSAKKAKEEEFPMELHEEGTKKGMPRKTARKAYEEPSKEEVKEMKKEVKKAEKKEEKKEKKSEKKEEKKSDSKKPAKGSKEMAERMARLRAMRGKKKE